MSFFLPWYLRGALVALLPLAGACSDGGSADTQGTGGGHTTSTGSAGGRDALCKGFKAPEGDATIELTSGGRKRSAFVHVPPGYDPEKPTPTVLAFPYGSGTPETMEDYTGLTPAADAAGFVLVYPIGYENVWNAGKCCGKAWKEDIDDVAYTSDLLDKLAETYCIDPDRTYLSGFSNGAMIAYLASCELADRIAGVAAVAGVLHSDAPCKPSRPVPVLHFHGDADEVVPIDGGEGVPPIPFAGSHTFISVDQNLGMWHEADACEPETRETYRNGDTTCVARTPCSAGTTVELCITEGGGHTWPMGNVPGFLGKTSQDIDANARMLEFFASHPAR
jgi:polyhydroxybutyrate depolymerase